MSNQIKVIDAGEKGLFIAHDPPLRPTGMLFVFPGEGIELSKLAITGLSRGNFPGTPYASYLMSDNVGHDFFQVSYDNRALGQPMLNEHDVNGAREIMLNLRKSVLFPHQPRLVTPFVFQGNAQEKGCTVSIVHRRRDPSRFLDVEITVFEYRNGNWVAYKEIDLGEKTTTDVLLPYGSYVLAAAHKQKHLLEIGGSEEADIEVIPPLTSAQHPTGSVNRPQRHETK